MNPTSSLKESFETQGFVVLENFFKAPQLEKVTESLNLHYSGEKGGFVDKAENFRQFQTETDPWVPSKEERPPFETLEKDSRLVEITGQLLGLDYAEVMCLIMRTRPGTGQAWHQDTKYESPAKFILNRVIYPWDTPEEAGGLVVVPGSHRRGRIPKGGNHESLPGEVLLLPKAGMVAFMNGHLWHRVPLNRSTQPRFSVNLRARPATVPQDYTRVGVYRNGAYDFQELRPLDQ